mmetsp:Transcript_50052/g.156648  ORF Transcript_50052/g.156648 Transcript_50052/m.156648 type:complete len:285 (-) Transcript_50052:329-1183(-)
MREGQQAGVQRLSLDEQLRGAQALLPLAHVPRLHDVPNLELPAPVYLVPHDRVPQVRQVNADLVGAAGEELQLNQRETLVPLPHHEARLRRLPLPLPAHCKLDGVVGMPADGQVDQPAVLHHLPVHEGNVPLPRGPQSKLLVQAPVSKLRLGRHHHPCRVPVQPMDDARPRVLCSDLRQAAAAPVHEVPCKRVHKGPIGSCRARMDDEVGLLVDDNHVLVLVNHCKWNVLGRHVVARWRRKVDDDGLTCLELLRWLRGLAVHQDAFGLDHPVEGRPREDRDPLR